MVKNLPANAGDRRDINLILGLGRSPGGGNGNPRQYSCLENPMDRGAWWATVRRVAKSHTQLSMHANEGKARSLTVSCGEARERSRHRRATPLPLRRPLSDCILAADIHRVLEL